MIYKRQKVLLKVVNKLSEQGIHSKTYVIKIVFLLRQKLGFESVSYDFFPYKFGPFSNEIYRDFNSLHVQGLFDESNLCLTNKGKEFIKNLQPNESVHSELDKIISEFPRQNLIVDFVYKKYPAFTIRSEKLERKKDSGAGIFSIGYEGKTIDRFLNELVQNNISLLIDVRRNAFSMKKGFSKNQIKNYLKNAGISYLHLPALGVESEKRKNLETKADYGALFKEYKRSLPSKKDEILRIEELGNKQKIALMCFEADKNFCHRGVLSNFLSLEVVHL